MDIIAVKTIFLKYLLAPLATILLLVALVYLKKKTPSLKTKALIIYTLVCALCLGLPGFLGITGNMFNPYWYLLVMIMMLSLGILHVNLLKTFFPHSNKPLWFTIVFESVLTLTCMLLGGYIFYLIYNWMSPYSGYSIMAATSLFIFIVPLSFFYCYLQFINIPFDIYNTWQPIHNQVPMDFDKIRFKSVLVLNLELIKKTESQDRFSVNAKAPTDGVSFGEWFFKFVDDYNFKNPNSSIHLYQSGGDAYSWIFYTKKSLLHFRKFIDFNQTISANKLSERNTIFCKRVIELEQEAK